MKKFLAISLSVLFSFSALADESSDYFEKLEKLRKDVDCKVEVFHDDGSALEITPVWSDTFLVGPVFTINAPDRDRRIQGVIQLAPLEEGAIRGMVAMELFVSDQNDQTIASGVVRYTMLVPSGSPAELILYSEKTRYSVTCLLK